MPKYSRKEKNKELHHQIALDNERQLNTKSKELKDYSERITTIEPRIIHQETTSSINQTLDHLNEILDNKPSPIDNTEYSGPFGKSFNTKYVSEPNVPTNIPKSFEYSEPSSNSKKDDTTTDWKIDLFSDHDYSEKNHSSKANTSGNDHMSADDIKKEFNQLLSKNDAPLSHSSESTPSTIDSIMYETHQIQQELIERADELDNVETKLKETHKIINILLYMLILSLGVVLLTVVYFIIKKHAIV